MYCLISLPRAGSIAAYSWILESLSVKYPKYKESVDILFTQADDPRIFKNVAEIFEEINVHNPIYEHVKNFNRYSNLEQSLLSGMYYYDLHLYNVLNQLTPTPVVSLKVCKSYAIMDNFISNEKYKTITLTRKDLKQQFLSFIVSTETQTFHGNQETIFNRRKNYNKIEVLPVMFERWFDWLCKLHRVKQITDYTFYYEDIENDPNFFLESIGLPKIKNYNRIIQKTKNREFIKHIKNPNVFEETWDAYSTIYKDIL